MIREPDVALTDYFLTVECFLFAWFLGRQKNADPGLRRLFALFYVSSGVAALAGGSVHGFFPDPVPAAGVWLWKATVLALGVATLSAWCFGAKLIFASNGVRIVRSLAVTVFVGYAWVVIFVSDKFWIAIVHYAPSVVFLMVALSIVSFREHRRDLLVGLAGLVLMPFAAVLQQLKVAVDPVHFNHNATYHVLQAVAFAMLFSAAKRLISPKGDGVI